MHTRIDEGDTNEMIVVTDVDPFSSPERTELQSRIEAICSDTKLVNSLRIEYETEPGGLRTIIFGTTAPDRLYAELRARLLDSPDFGPRMWDSTWARWTGEDVFLDSIWVHRPPVRGPDQLDGLENRHKCVSCGGYFWRGHVEDDGRCPYCEHFDSSLLKRNG